MPELPEVEIVRRSLLPLVSNRQLGEVHIRDRRLRQPVDSRRLRRNLPGRRILDIRRRAKYLLFDLEGGLVLMLHLGMSGRLGVVPDRQQLQRHDHLVFSLEGGLQLRFNDPRRFGLVELLTRKGEAAHPRLRHLGLEPLEPTFQASTLQSAARGSRRPVKNFLMDATRVVGIGNIYASEALFVARIHPKRPAGRLSTQRWERLATAIRSVLTRAIQKGGTTLRNFSDAQGNSGTYGLKLQVYDREAASCRRCHGRIRRIVQAGRSTFYCPGCQH